MQAHQLCFLEILHCPRDFSDEYCTSNRHAKAGAETLFGRRSEAGLKSSAAMLPWDTPITHCRF
jgi:hypothetical protein